MGCYRYAERGEERASVALSSKVMRGHQVYGRGILLLLPLIRQTRPVASYSIFRSTSTAGRCAIRFNRYIVSTVDRMAANATPQRYAHGTAKN